MIEKLIIIFMVSFIFFFFGLLLLNIQIEYILLFETEEKRLKWMLKHNLIKMRS